MRSTRLIAVLLALLWAVPSEAAISRIGSCAAQTTSCTFSVAPTSGDAIVVFAHHDGSTAPPTPPTVALTSPAATASQYALLVQGGANTNAAILGVRISDGTETTTGTWTGATSIAAVIYRGANVAPIGNFASGGASSATLAYNTFTLNKTDGSSWVIGFAAHRTATNVTSAPTNMTLVTSATDIAVSDTNAGVSSWSTQTTGVNATSGWRSYAVELLAQTGEGTTKLYVDDYLNMNTVDASPTALTGTIMNNGVQGAESGGTWNCYDDNANAIDSNADWNINATQWSAPATIRVRSTATDYAVGSTSRTLRFLHTTLHFHDCRVENLAATRHRGAVTVAGWVQFGPTNAGVSGNLLDYWRVQTVDGNFCVFQLNNGDGGTGYHIRIESNPAGTTRQGSNITPTPATRYWVVLHCNFQAATSSLAIYDTGGTQVGSTVSGNLQYTPSDMGNGAYVDQIWIGNAETQTNNLTTTIFEHILFDYSAATFPLGPAVSGGGATITCVRSLRGFGCDLAPTRDPQ
jgi:hypothetical protein